MPTISMFFGIIIRLYYSPDEHPPPHFHVYYSEFKGTVDIRTCELIEGDLPRRQTKLVLAWAELHQEELMADWNLVMNGEEPFKIQPLQECPMFPAVTKVVPGEDYTLMITFDNGEKGILDMKPMLDFGVFKRIKDDAAFKRVRVAFDTIEWECGVDLDPEYVYARCKASTPDRSG